MKIEVRVNGSTRGRGNTDSTKPLDKYTFLYGEEIENFVFA
jgi:hypothetical protein